MGTDIYIITELARTDLLDYIRFHGALRETLCRRLFFDLASGVEYMHSINLVHRDIKWYQTQGIRLVGKGSWKVLSWKV